ncbi:MAG: site-specific integrase, partial [Syntrophomonadaceae bacterium]|nr:site-specific integrase [Syntrophomonadaceae bacterium]
EICGLRFEDIDLVSGILTVSRTVIRIKVTDEQAATKTRVILDAPKTQSSRRQIPLPAFLIALAAEQCKAAGRTDAYILTGTQDIAEPRTYYRQYQAILEACGLKPHTFHALRHSFATRCVEQGCDPKTLSELLGHANVKITLERYVHPSMRSKRAVVERLAQEDSWSETGVAVP